MTLYYIARKLNIDIGKVVITADGFVDPRGFRGEESVPSHFNKVILDVHIHSLEGEDVIGQLKEKVETQCPVHSLFKAAGVQVESQWVVNVGA